MIGFGSAIWIFLAVLFIVIINDDPGHKALLVFLPLLIFMGTVLVVVIEGVSDIEISQESISRKVFGCVIREFNWDDVDMIRAFDSYDFRTSERILAIHVFKKKSAKRVNFLSKKMVFGDEAMSHGNFHDLIESLNFFSSRYNIIIESSFGGKRVRENKIPYKIN
ncbi:hypothetical protein [Dyella sp.]|uniref:hypothetical protein n=1 Tax=Dyella sp. TaxID=1869338 RepID=UPI002ED63C3C